ncbi:MAG: NADP-dependent malic enzyme [Bacillales bacterium]|nr:NADP-dependent malic enzyme [Bacillales bacterium]
MEYAQESLILHRKNKGKIQISNKVPLETMDDLALAYTPGVAEPCLEIVRNPEAVFDLTNRGNTVAVITDGSAVLGLGNIGPEAAIPVMEGKCAIFKRFANIDALPVVLKTNDVEELVRTIYLLSSNYAGINLEDISAPRCFEVEERLRDICSIPVFHDDQHGTAIVAGAALLNALKVVNKKIENIKVVINGAGSAGIAIGKFLLCLGVKHLTLVDRFGIINKGDKNNNSAQEKMAQVTNIDNRVGSLKDALIGSDVFIGVSIGNIVSQEMIRSMNKDAIVFPLANPTPEISREDALKAGAAIVGTGVSNLPNQINNALVFPAIFKGAIDVRAKQITAKMEIAAALALANTVSEKELNALYILPNIFKEGIHQKIAEAVSKAV